MKNILLILIALLCAIGYSQETPKNDLEKLRLKGKIKHIETTMYKIVDRFGEIIKTEMIKPVCGAYFFAYSPSQSSLFDERGNIMVTDNYDSNGDLERKTIYKYDNKGNEIEVIVYRDGVPEYFSESKIVYYD